MKRFFSFSLIGLLLASCAARGRELSGALSSDQRNLVRQVGSALEQLPDMPHRRTRNRELGSLAEAAVEAGEGALALEIIESIDNWRADQLKAKLAVLYYSEGRESEARLLIDEAARKAETIIDLKSGKIIAAGEQHNLLEQYEDFRLDRIKIALAKYCWVTGDKEAAKEWSRDVLAAEQGEFIELQAKSLEQEDYEASLALNMLLAKGETFEGKITAIAGLVRLYERYFDDVEKRQELETVIEELSISMPIQHRVEWLHNMALAAFVHGDAGTAEGFYREASILIGDSDFRPRMFFPLKAANIITAYKLDYAEDAQEALELLCQEYGKIEEDVFDIHRADLLCSLAEAYAFMGNKERSEEMYLKALEQAGMNPNSRPRVEDLNLVVLSMIKSNEPLSPVFQEKFDALIGSLGEPW